MDIAIVALGIVGAAMVIAGLKVGVHQAHERRTKLRAAARRCQRRQDPKTGRFV